MNESFIMWDVLSDLDFTAHNKYAWHLRQKTTHSVFLFNLDIFFYLLLRLIPESSNSEIFAAKKSDQRISKALKVIWRIRSANENVWLPNLCRGERAWPPNIW